MRAVLASLILLAMTPFPALAQQSAVPEGRFVVSRDVDFYGSDLAALFDTTLDACIRACTLDNACAAFTFNARSNACFPKSSLAERTPYEGAISARKLATDPAILAQADGLRARLGFLSDDDIAAARRLVIGIGFRHSAGDLALDQILAAAAGAAPAEALGWTGMAVSLTGRADLWTEYARLSLVVAPQRSSDRRAYQARALNAATAGYLHGRTAPERAAALLQMSDALEALGRGRDMIPALRLAMDETPRNDIDAALGAAIGKYGFRIVNTSVESDSAAPRICAEFSEDLLKAGVDYETYVRLPDPALVVQVDGMQLCVDGVVHGERYAVTFRAGLPGISGEVLSKDVEVTQYVRDRSPLVRFPGRSYVLPKAADAALPVETVNTGALELVLRRVSDRNLLRAVQDDYFGRPLAEWQERDFADQIAQEVWTGSAVVGMEVNRDMTTRLPMGEAIAGAEPGIYALTARVPGADPYDIPSATQWFVLSDMGISTLAGTDGLHVDVRSLSDAAPRAGVDLTLVSQANAVLGTAVTDSDGQAVFAAGLTRGTGAAAPALLLAADGETDVGFLPLSGPAFDMSDRGVEGRDPSGPVDVFLTTDRGAYRAGEVIFVTALARTGEATAIPDLPLTAILLRPDGVEHARLLSSDPKAGGHAFAMPLGPAVPRGTWRIEVKADPAAAALATQTVLVEDFLPERIDFDLSLPDALLRPGDTPPLTVEVRYLFGAPGADLPVEGSVILRATRTLEEWPGYRFGRYDEPARPRSEYFGGARTDGQGRAIVPVELPDTDAAGMPLEATVTVRVAEGSGRPVEREIIAPVRPDGPVIGIRPLFDDVVGEGQEAGFSVIGLGSDLGQMTMDVTWTLNRVETRYQWYQLYGNWNWEPTTRRSRIATGQARLDGDPLRLDLPVDWGRYELVVERTDGDYAAAAQDFYAGWYAPEGAADTPDVLAVSLDREDYTVGDTAQLRIVSRFVGTALVSVLSNRVIDRKVIEVDEGETVIPVEVAADWGAGAYVSATVIRPMDVSAGQNPARALGIAYATVAPGKKALEVSIDVPDIVRPRGPQRVRVDVAGLASDDSGWLTLAAVDVGILNLTGFQSPDPQAHYFGQRRLGVEMRDVYGRLIDGMNGALGTVRSGGDANAGMQMQSPPPTQKLMAVFSGPISVGADGAAFVNIDLPAFNGTVRLMAVAWSETGVGQAARDMIVRDPVVVAASLPRYLAPGDESRMRFDLTHTSGPTGAMTLALSAPGALILGADRVQVMLTEGGSQTVDIPVVAGLPGDHVVRAVLETPDGQSLAQELVLPVRSNDPEIAVTQRFSLGAGETFTLDDNVFAAFQPGSGSALLSAGPLARFDAPGLLAMLDRYPYGCTEQVTSQAMPLLYLSAVAEASGLGDGPRVADRIDAAIDRILSRQAPNGAFGLWSPSAGDLWLDAYVGDFLSRARSQGFDVPDRAFRMAMDNLRNQVNYAPEFDIGGEALAYALMVLAREGAAAIGDLRYYADERGEGFATPLAKAQLGAALAAYGDPTRADRMFGLAMRQLQVQDGATAPVWRDDYGTRLRDAAGVLTLAAEVGSDAVDRVALTRRVNADGARRSTQEAAWSLLAAHALIDGPGSGDLTVNGQPINGPFVQLLEASVTGRSYAVRTAAVTDITLTTIGVPVTPPPAGGTGYAIRRAYFDMDGQPLDPAQTRVGDRFVAVLTVDPADDTGARLMIDDPLPAGFEIDNPSLLRSGDIGALDWLEVDEAQHAEFRSDRFLAAVDLRGGGRVRLAYVVRAVTPGTYRHPAASVEDMYRPRYRARTETGQVIVSE